MGYAILSGLPFHFESTLFLIFQDLPIFPFEGIWGHLKAMVKNEVFVGVRVPGLACRWGRRLHAFHQANHLDVQRVL